MRKRYWAVITLAVLLAGCGELRRGVTVTTTDSSGVAIVENEGSGRTIAFSTEREYALGGEPSGPESFYDLYPFRVSVGSDGRIAVLNRQASQVSVFDAAGLHLATFGEEGDGPGELRLPSSVAAMPDSSVIVFDYQKRSLVRFGPDGTFLTETRLGVPFNGVGMVGTPTGLLLLSRDRPQGSGEESARVLHLSERDTVQLGPTVTSTSKTVIYSSCGMSLSQPPLFAAQLVWGSNGSRTAVVAGPEYSIAVFDGVDLVQIVRRDLEPKPVTREVAARLLGDGEHWTIGGRDCVVPVDEVLDRRGYADVVPLIEAVAVQPSGGLWVKRRIPGADADSVDVFDQEGRYVGTASPELPFPIRFLPDGEAVAIERDSLDVDRVLVYSARRR